MYAKYSRLFSKTPQVDYLWMCHFRPNLILMHQHECHSILSNICHYMSNIKPFLSATTHVCSLNQFIWVITTMAPFLGKLYLKSPKHSINTCYSTCYLRTNLNKYHCPTNLNKYFCPTNLNKYCCGSWNKMYYFISFLLLHKMIVHLIIHNIKINLH